MASAKTLSVTIKMARISGFCGTTEMDFQRLAGPRIVSVDFKYDVQCL